MMCVPFVRSFSIYASAELLTFKVREDDITKSLKRILFGMTVDVLCIRSFHKKIDTFKLSSFQKTLIEQITIAPTISTCYLLLHDNFNEKTFKSLYLSDICFWSPTSYLGYSLIGTKKRFIYTGICSVCWANFRILNYT